MKQAKRTKKKVHWLIPLVVVAVIAFVFVKMVQLQVQLDEKQGEFNALQDQIAVTKIQNEDLAAKNDSLDTDKGQKQQLYDYGYVNDNDQVYVYTNN